MYAGAEAPIFWSHDKKKWLIGKDPEAGKDWRLEKKGMTEDEMVGWHQWLNGYEFEQSPGDSELQGSLGFCSPWGRKELDMTEQLNNNTAPSYPYHHISHIPHLTGKGINKDRERKCFLFFSNYMSPVLLTFFHAPEILNCSDSSGYIQYLGENCPP